MHERAFSSGRHEARGDGRHDAVAAMGDMMRFL